MTVDGEQLPGEVLARIVKIDEEREQAYRDLYESLEKAAAAIGDDEESRNRLFAEVYWHPLDIPIYFLTDTFGVRRKRVLQYAGTGRVDATCEDCGLEGWITVNSRMDRQKSRGRQKLCEPCKQRRREEALERRRREEEYKRSEEYKNRRIAELKTMPYDEYLQTPEWKETRLKALEAAGRRCAVCNHHGRLDVHHRTYERRGCELPDDLTVLCRPCHEVFHKTRRVVRTG